MLFIYGDVAKKAYVEQLPGLLIGRILVWHANIIVLDMI